MHPQIGNIIEKAKGLAAYAANPSFYCEFVLSAS